MKIDFRNLQFIFKPSYWLMNYPYSKEVDEILTELLDKYELSDLSSTGATCKLGKVTVWVENRPYASGTLYGTKFDNLRPSRLTIQRLLKKFYELRYSVNEQDVKEFRDKFM